MKFEILLHYSVISHTPGWSMTRKYFSFEKTSRNFIETKSNLQNESNFTAKLGTWSNQRPIRKILWLTSPATDQRAFRPTCLLALRVSSCEYLERIYSKIYVHYDVGFCRRIIGICNNPVATSSIWSII